MESYNLKHLYNSKKILENLKSSLPADVFFRANIFVERALNPEIKRAKYIYQIYLELGVYSRKLEGTKEGKELNTLLALALDGFNINLHYKLLTSQEHYLIGSIPPNNLVILNHYTPIAYYFVPAELKSYQIKLYRNSLLVSFTNLGNYFGFETNLKTKYYFLLEELDSKNQTKKDPRLVDFEKLLNLMVNEPKNFELADIEEIYQECKIKFKYSKNFPFSRVEQ